MLHGSPRAIWLGPCFPTRTVAVLYKKPTRARLAAGIGGLVVLSAFAGLWVASRAYRPAILKERMEALLSDQLEGEVTLDSLEGTFFPRVALSGGGLVVRHKGRTDVPPLLTIEHFEIRASFRALMNKPRHVAEVRLQGLQVHIPPGGNERDESDRTPDASEGEDKEYFYRFSPEGYAIAIDVMLYVMSH